MSFWNIRRNKKIQTMLGYKHIAHSYDDEKRILTINGYDFKYDSIEDIDISIKLFKRAKLENDEEIELFKEPFMHKVLNDPIGTLNGDKSRTLNEVKVYKVDLIVKMGFNIRFGGGIYTESDEQLFIREAELKRLVDEIWNHISTFRTPKTMRIDDNHNHSKVIS